MKEIWKFMMIQLPIVTADLQTIRREYFPFDKISDEEF